MKPSSLKKLGSEGAFWFMYSFLIFHSVMQECRLLHWWMLHQIKRIQSSLLLISKIIGFLYSASIMLHFDDLVNSIVCQVLS